MEDIRCVDLLVRVPPVVGQEPAETEALRAGIIQAPQQGASAVAVDRYRSRQGTGISLISCLIRCEWVGLSWGLGALGVAGRGRGLCMLTSGSGGAR